MAPDLMRSSTVWFFSVDGRDCLEGANEPSSRLG
jgi:hypothetical protein